VRLLCVASAPTTAVATAARDLEARGHDVALVVADRPRRLPRVASTARGRTVALMDLGPASWPLSQVLAAMGLPVVLSVDEPTVARLRDADRGWSRAWVEQSVQGAARTARAIVTAREGWARALESYTGIRGVTVLDDGLDLRAFPPLQASAAKRALRLPEHPRFVALTAPLGPTARVDLLALAHRKIPGVGLLVAAAGPGLTTIDAMGLATRPSSPVVRLSADAPTVHHAIAAAELGLSLEPSGPGPEAWLYAGLGRRQVGFPSPIFPRLQGWFPDQHPAIAVDRATPEALQAAIERGLALAAAHGPLSAEDTARARARIGSGNALDRLEQVLTECA
jgi:SH3-like domain-containing protein